MCGKRVDEPVDQPVMPGLETTRVPQADADVVAAPMPGVAPTALESTPDVAVAPLPGLETTHLQTPEVAIERMPGLITNDEALGDTRIPDPPEPENPRCPRCKVEVAGERFCPRCGYAVVIEAAKEGEAPSVVCLECGVPNPPDRTQCMACGNRM